MVDVKLYQDHFYENFKNTELNDLESELEQTILYGSDGRGRLAEVPLIKVGVLENLIKARKGN